MRLVFSKDIDLDVLEEAIGRAVGSLNDLDIKPASILASNGQFTSIYRDFNVYS